MSWEPLESIEGVQVLDLTEFTDERGSLSEGWRRDELRYRSAVYKPAMLYTSWTLPGQIRGPHEHREQADLFVFAGPGSFKLYLWLRDMHSIVFVGDPKLVGCRRRAVLIPPGVVHGYHCVSEESGLVINMPDSLYRGVRKKGEVDEVRHEDDPDSPYTIPSVL